MKRFLLFVLLSYMVTTGWGFQKTYFPPTLESQYICEEYLPESLPEITFEELKGQSYVILEETEDYLIVEIDGDIYVVWK